MIKYLIIDDEFIAHDIIKGYTELMPNLEWSKSCFNALEAIAFLRDQHVDLIFLDLNLPKLKGFEFLRTLTTPPQIIVTTAYQEYALEGYELNIKDYLLKPFSFERFIKAINKVESTVVEEVKIKTQTTEDSIFLYSNKTHIQIKINDLLYVEAAGNYCKVVTIDKSISVREKISSLNKQFPRQKFTQVHKSFIVANQHVDKIEGNRIHIGDSEIPIGKMFKLNIAKILKT